MAAKSSAKNLASPKILVIIEAPGKLKKLQSILGPNYLVMASGGHIRELANDGEDSLGFSIDGDLINCRWAPRNPQSKKTISSLKAAAKSALAVLIATDEDREGETIGWHLAEELKLKKPQRITYREITPSAVQAAVANPRPIDFNLVDAGLCRSVLDKLVGYKGSPLVWKLNNGARSVGRVQSAALHLVAERERQITNFIPEDYWLCAVEYQEGFQAIYHGPHAEQQQVTDENAVEAEQGDVPESTRIRTQEEADRILMEAQTNPHHVVQVEAKTVHRNPSPPFTTSTLQQAASSKLKLSPDQTMKLAQSLYEKGLITYHRTDSTFLAPEFVQAAKAWIKVNDTENYQEQHITFKSGKNAQEAHEAIRPTHIAKSSKDVAQEVSTPEFNLYLLIWNRTIASLCAPAAVCQSTIITQSGSVQWIARGQVLEFAGFTKYWASVGEDQELPPVNQGQLLTLLSAGAQQKSTQPPSRYSEAQLVALMERKGIGRPSTYAPTIQTLKDRGYVFLDRLKVHPSTVGMEVDTFLVQTLPKLVDVDFTAEMESQLDRIAEGKEDWQLWLTGWNREYFEPALDQAHVLAPQFAIECSKASRAVQVEAATTASIPIRAGSSTRRKTTKPANIACPVCGVVMEEYHYTKDGASKLMLRCSDAQARAQSDHRAAVYFKTDRGFWSPQFGNLSSETPSKSTSRKAPGTTKEKPPLRKARRSSIR